MSGDLNFGNDYCRKFQLTPKPLDHQGSDLFSHFGYTQLIDIPTRISRNCTSLIDLVFVDRIDDVVVHGTIPGPADHEGVFTSFTTISSRPKPRKIKIFDYDNTDLTGLNNHLDSIDWKQLVYNRPTADQPSAMSDILTDALNKFVPTKFVTTRHNDQPWTNARTRQLLRKKEPQL